MPHAETPLIYDVDDGIAIITINNPGRGNATNGEIVNLVQAAWERVNSDPSVRVAIITAAGTRHFCTGFDVEGFSQEDSPLKNLPIDFVLKLSPIQNRVLKPVICAVNGLVNGGGLHLVVDCDIIVACESASFMDSHVNVGQVGAVENIGLTKRLPLGTALRMTLQGRSFRLGASRAYTLGLVDELVESSAEVLPKAMEIAREVAKNSPQALALSKQALWDSLEMGYSQACENGWNLVRLQWSHPDFEEGPRAFTEKREPRWDPNPNATARS